MRQFKRAKFLKITLQIGPAKMFFSGPAVGLDIPGLETELKTELQA